MIISHISGSNVFKGLIVVSVLLVGGFFVSGAQAATFDATFTSANPADVDSSFTPSIGASVVRNTMVYLGRTTTYVGPAIGTLGDTIKWKVTITSDSSVLTPDMVDLDEVGFDDPGGVGNSIGTYHYPFTAGSATNQVVALGSCDTADLHNDACAHDVGFSLDENDVFTNADSIKFNSNAPLGNYNIAYQLVDTKGTADTADDDVSITSYTVPVEVTLEPVLNVTTGSRYLTIQDAINAASSGDTINVADGNYAENVIITSKPNLTLQASGSGANINPASGIGIAITSSNGVTIQGLNITTTGLDAHGIWVAGTPSGGSAVSNLTVQDSAITVNGYSSGIYAEQVSPAHSGWLIGGSGHGNTIIINDGTGGTGDGADLIDVSDSELSYNTITLNNPISSTNVLWFSELSNLSNIAFSNNTVSGSSGSEIAILTDFLPSGADTSITTVTISNNTFSNWGSRALRVGTANGAGTVSSITVSSNTFNMTTDTTEVIGGSAASSAIGSSNTFNVSGTAKIQKAINAAFTGDTVNVAAGTYSTTGQIIIDKNLTIIGTGGKPVIQPDADLPQTNFVAGAWFLVNPNVTFSLSNFVLDGNGLKVHQAVRSHGATTIENVDFLDIRNSTNQYVGFAIAGFGGTVPGGAGSDTHGAGGASSTLTVTNSTFAQIGRIGILVKGTDSTATISGNTYTGKGDGDFLDYAFEAGAGGSINVSGNTISGNRGVAASDGSTSAGILVTDYYGTGTEATITNNTITDNTEGIAVGYNSSDASVVVAHNNKFISNDMGISSTNPVVDATNNWWGSVSGPFHLTDNPNGTGDEVSDNVNFSPYYIDAAKTTLSSDVQVVLEEKTVLDPEGDVTQVVVSSENTASSTITASGYMDATINLVSLVTETDGMKEATLAGGLTINSAASIGQIKVEIPAGTTISASTTAWNGVISTPKYLPSSSGTPTPSTGNQISSVFAVIELGGDTPLTLSNGVRIFLPGEAGRKVGFSQDGIFTEITGTCADTQEAGDALLPNGTCKASVGADLVVWTKHFTQFITYTEVAAVVRTGGNVGGGGEPTTPTPTVTTPTQTVAVTTPAAGQVLGVATFSFTQTLKTGSEGNDVTELQNRLTAEGVYSGPVTGYFGPLTEAGVKAFQAKYGIEQAGIVGPLTRTKLNESVAAVPAPGQVLGATTVDKAQLQAQLASLQEQLKELLQKLVEAMQNEVNRQLKLSQ